MAAQCAGATVASEERPDVGAIVARVSSAAVGGMVIECARKIPTWCSFDLNMPRSTPEVCRPSSTSSGRRRNARYIGPPRLLADGGHAVHLRRDTERGKVTKWKKLSRFFHVFHSPTFTTSPIRVVAAGEGEVLTDSAAATPPRY